MRTGRIIALDNSNDRGIIEDNHHQEISFLISKNENLEAGKRVSFKIELSAEGLVATDVRPLDLTQPPQFF